MPRPALQACFAAALTASQAVPRAVAIWRHLFFFFFFFFDRMYQVVAVLADNTLRFVIKEPISMTVPSSMKTSAVLKICRVSGEDHVIADITENQSVELVADWIPASNKPAATASIIRHRSRSRKTAQCRTIPRRMNTIVEKNTDDQLLKSNGLLFLAEHAAVVSTLHFRRGPE